MLFTPLSDRLAFQVLRFGCSDIPPLLSLLTWASGFGLLLCGVAAALLVKVCAQ